MTLPDKMKVVAHDGEIRIKQKDGKYDFIQGTVVLLSDAIKIAQDHADEAVKDERERIIRRIETVRDKFHKKLEKDEIYACNEILEQIKGACDG